MFYLKKSQWPIFIITLIYLAIFLFIFFKRKNYEFIFYIIVVAFFLLLVLFTNKKVQYPNFVLWGLSLWGLLHMSGGGVLLNNGTMRLYEVILIPLSETYKIFKYDQFVHIIGFGVATLLAYVLLKPSLKEKPAGWVSLGIVIAMAGLGIGAINEMIEFMATVISPETGVGGYINTSLDLVADLIGALIATVYLWARKGKLK